MFKSLSVTLSRFKHKQEHQMEVCKKNTRLGHVRNNWSLWSPDSSFEIYMKRFEGFGTGHHGPSVHVTNAFQTLLQLFGSFAGGLPRTARSLRLPSAGISFSVLMWCFEEWRGTRTNDFVYSHQLDGHLKTYCLAFPVAMRQVLRGWSWEVPLIITP